MTGPGKKTQCKNQMNEQGIYIKSLGGLSNSKGLNLEYY